MTVGAETHVSWVFFTDELAYKIYKPIRTDVLDHRDPVIRHWACQQEVEVNRRFAPDVYLGVADIVMDGQSIEHAVVMRRLPDEAKLSRHLAGSEGLDSIRAVARRIASIHAHQPPLAPELARSVASPEALRARWANDIATLRELADGRLDRSSIEDLSRLSMHYLEGRGPLLEDRIRQGLVLDGHGDLQAEDIFVLPDGPRLLDALAFDDRLRWGDVLADVGFLVMDLHRLGHRELACELLRIYSELTGETHPGSLAHFYVAQRAVVRAKVMALRAHQSGDQIDWLIASGLVDVALEHLERAQPRVVLVGGIPGSGKSTIAHGMADRFGWVVIGTDETRHDLGLRGANGTDRGNYAPDRVDEVYTQVLDRTRSALGMGQSVIIDATWSDARHRELVRTMARKASAVTHELRCVTDIQQCVKRVEARTDASSDATRHVVTTMAERFAGWPEAIDIDTSLPPTDAVEQAMGSLLTHPWPARPQEVPI